MRSGAFARWVGRSSRGRWAPVAAVLAGALPTGVAAGDWETSVSIYGWLSGLDTAVETPLGTVQADLSFSDVLDALNFAVFANVEARNGPWVVIGDLNYSDLSADRETPFGVLFSRATVDTSLTVLAGFVGYTVMDQPQLRIDAGGGLRLYDLDVETRLAGNPPVPDQKLPVSDSWADTFLGVNLTAPLSDRWFARSYADVGGFGIGSSSVLSWQVYLGGGYILNDTWAVEAGYRHLSIEKDVDSGTFELDQFGPVIGVTARF